MRDKRKMNIYEAVVQGFRVLVYSKNDIDGVNDFLLSHYKWGVCMVDSVSEKQMEARKEYYSSLPKLHINYAAANTLMAFVDKEQWERIESGEQTEYYIPIGIFNISRTMVSQRIVGDDTYYEFVRPFMLSAKEEQPLRLQAAIHRGEYVHKHRFIQFIMKPVNDKSKECLKLVKNVSVGVGNPEWGAKFNESVIIVKIDEFNK